MRLGVNGGSWKIAGASNESGVGTTCERESMDEVVNGKPA